jgi:glycosyltransferase involved in cell wall biosynthesis
MFLHAFPPAGGGGVIRAAKLVKYLPEAGWQPVVCTPRISPAGSLDSSLLSGIPPEVAVHRVGSSFLEFLWHRTAGSLGYFGPAQKNMNLLNILVKLKSFLKGLFMFPDEHVLWMPVAFNHFRKISTEKLPAVVFTSSPPESVHLAGLAVKCAFPEVKWVMEFRDMWGRGHDIFGPYLPLHRMLERRLAHKVDHIVVVTGQMKDSIRQKLNLPAHRVSVVPNGFDPADFVCREDGWRREGEKVITYAGSMNKTRCSAALLEALAELREEGNLRGLKIVVVGVMDPGYRQMIRQKRLEHVFQYTGFLPHAQAVQYICRSDWGLATLSAEARRADENHVPGKVYEYVGAQKPVLALVPAAGAVSRLVEEHRLGIVAPPGDKEAVKRALRIIMAGTFTPAHSDFLQAGLLYSRRRTARQMAEVLNMVCNGGSKPCAG